MNLVFAALPTTVFEEMSGLARQHGAINLGQGFPDAAGPEDVRRKAAEAAVTGYNQYPPMRGIMIGDEELAALAEFCIAHDLIAISDEVWEHVVFDGAVHRSPMTAPGMAERTVKIGSAGKIFSLTGWKTGWVIAAPVLLDVIAKAHQFLTFTTPPPLQAAVAYGLGKETDYFIEMRAGYRRSRDRLASGLDAAGYAVFAPEASYFLSIDLAASGLVIGDRDFCHRIVAEHGVAAIPVSAFYEEAPVTHLARLCFAKADDTIDAAVERLAGAKRALG